jgi:acyl-CoA synthetase (AMP-forming)/AMP-acid ligase II
MNLAALLFEVARRLPDRPAVSDGRNSWSYRELMERAARIGGALRARGGRSFRAGNDIGAKGPGADGIGGNVD